MDLPSILEQEGMDNLEEFMLEYNIPLEVNHMFTDTQYVREMIVPAGTVVLGKRHKKKTLNMLLQGSFVLYNEYGKEEGFFTAPYIFESDAKVKKIGKFLEDSIFVNVFVTTTRDFDELEKELYCEEDVGKNSVQNYDGSLIKGCLDE